MLSTVVRNGRIALNVPTDLPDGTLVELGVHSPGTVAPDAGDFLPAELQPAIATMGRLWRALGEGDSDGVALYRERLVANLDPCIGDGRLLSDPDSVRLAPRRLSGAPSNEVRRQDLAALELAVLDARLPLTPDGAHDEDNSFPTTDTGRFG